MQSKAESFAQEVNFTRYKNLKTGHYESFFQRANHPTRPLAFWIRYTIFSQKNHPQDALAELWAIFFNGEAGQHVAVKREVPLKQCVFSPSSFFVEIDKARLEPGKLFGRVNTNEYALAWDLTFTSDAKPLLLLPPELYQTKLPAAKSLVGYPMATYNGHLTVNGENIPIMNWVGSQNHNWGSRHTDLYAWGQVAGFDTHPESFLEVATARLKIGPLWTPYMTLLVLRYNHQEYTLNSLVQSLKAKGTFDYFSWTFRSETKQIAVEGTISAPNEAFVGLNYYNPPGGTKHCLNTKIASCIVRFVNKQQHTTETLMTQNRSAFEILTDDHKHGITIRA
jgi:hypothetical protein